MTLCKAPTILAYKITNESSKFERDDTISITRSVMIVVTSTQVSIGFFEATEWGEATVEWVEVKYIKEERTIPTVILI